MKNQKPRQQRARRQHSQKAYKERAFRKAALQVTTTLPDGYTVASRGYGFALYADTPEEWNGEMCVRADTRLGGWSHEDYDLLCMAAHEHAETQAWRNYEKYF